MPIPIPQNMLTIPGVVGGWPLEVAEVVDRSPRIRRIGLTGEGLDGFHYDPGQDVMILLESLGDRALSRRYTIRDFDERQRLLHIEVVQHDADGPGQRWIAQAKAGDVVSVVGPRGKITLNPDAEWHLFVGDESFIPGALNMLEALPPDTAALAFLQVADTTDEAAFTPKGSNKQLTWLHNVGGDDADPSRLIEAIQRADLPSGRGYAYVAGEVQFTSALQRALLDKGFTPQQMSPKAYWGRAKANGPHGEPERPRD
jgi:NADPH-dependent ferric siderophore reductase